MSIFNKLAAIALALLLCGGLVHADGVQNPGGINKPSPSVAKKMVIFGDSITFWADVTNATNPGACAGNQCSSFIYQSYDTWASIYSQYRVTRIPNTGNCGYNGFTTAQLVAVTSCVTALAPDIVIYQAGANDNAAGTSCATTNANNKIIYQTFLNAGIAVIKVSTYPRGAPVAFTAAQANVAQCNNQFDRRYAEQNGYRGFYFVDLDPVMVDATTTGSWAAAAGVLYVDGAHVSSTGGSLAGNLIAAQINALAPAWRAPVFSNGDVYDAANNTVGNLLPNAIMTGTGGSVATCTGTVANSSNLGASNLGGATCVGSQTTLADGRKAMTVTIGGTSTGSNGQVTFWQNVATPANIGIGDVIEGQCWLNIGASTNFAGVSVTMKTIESAVTFLQDSSLPDTGTGFPTPAIAGYLPFITPRRTVTAVPSSAEIDVLMYFKTPLAAAAVAATISFTSCQIKKVLN